MELFRLEMMRNFKYCFLFIIGFILVSCTEKLKESQNTIGTLSGEVPNRNAPDKRMERKAKGDTLALNYQVLQKYLPEEINGYRVTNIPEGETVELPGMSFSLAEKNYKKGDSQLNISLFDYNGAYGMYDGATALFSAGLPVKNEVEEAQVFIMKDNIKGWEAYKRKEKKSELRIGIGERFYLTIKADKQEGTGQIKDIANKLPLDSLNNL
jgi:hypothetical protein